MKEWKSCKQAGREWRLERFCLTQHTRDNPPLHQLDRGGSYGKRNRTILSGDAYSPHVDHSSRSVCDRPPARREISPPLNPIATKPQPQRQTKRRSRRFLFQSKFGYPYQQICQVVSREHYPSLTNPSRTNNVSLTISLSAPSTLYRRLLTSPMSPIRGRGCLS